MAKIKQKKSGKLLGVKDRDLKVPEVDIDAVKEKISISSKTKKITIGVLLVVFAIVLILGNTGNAGQIGISLFNVFKNLFGAMYFFVPIIALVISYKLIAEKEIKVRWVSVVLAIISSVAVLGFINILSPVLKQGGLLGELLAVPIVSLIGKVPGAILLFGIFASLLLMILDLENIDIKNKNRLSIRIISWLKEKLPFMKKEVGLDGDEDIHNIVGDYQAEDEEMVPDETKQEEEIVEEVIEEVVKKKNLDDELKSSFVKKSKEKIPDAKISVGSELPNTEFEIRLDPKSTYTPPPLSLLERDKGKPNVGDIKANSNIIKRTLMNFGINVEMDEITVGPTVTRYSLKPAQGVKLTRILGLQQDLALALAAHPIRIEAPIPGKSLVGIEIPNKTKSMVGLASLFSDESFANGQNPLLVALGRGISGSAVVSDLTQMPHALIAGTTGSGKSVTIHTIITSLLYRNGPNDLKFIFVDPKRVELTLYNGIPHLISPVITQPKQAIMALKWASKEMERRYKILEENKARDITSYNKMIAKKGNKDEYENLPYIVIVIDELADLMQAFPRELEAGIVRLAQMSRAVGIHLIISTQRPSVEVITGLIKANIPTRIALQVASQIDSRTILDQPGAEKLLGRGDMLHLSYGSSQPERLQSAFISEDEVKSVVRHIVNQYKNEVPDEVIFSESNAIREDTDIFSAMVTDDEDDDDEMYEEAKREVISAGKASTSYLQRKLRVGYSRGARLMDLLEKRGIIGPGNKSREREVLIKMEDVNTMISNNNNIEI